MMANLCIIFQIGLLNLNIHSPFTPPLKTSPSFEPCIIWYLGNASVLKIPELLLKQLSGHFDLYTFLPHP